MGKLVGKFAKIIQLEIMITHYGVLHCSIPRLASERFVELRNLVGTNVFPYSSVLQFPSHPSGSGTSPAMPTKACS